MPSISSPTQADIERIAAQPDPVVRNLQITQCYHELAIAMRQRTGAGANWCTFATWASKQAGQTIRKQDLTRLLESVLLSQDDIHQAAQALANTAQRLGSRTSMDELLLLMWHAYDPEAGFERSSAAVSRGNLKVFTEIGRQFARFNHECLPDVTYDPDHIERFCEGLTPGEPPDGQELLKKAFRRYYAAFFETEPKPRNETLLLANLQIGLHEQTRLQPEINAALQAPVVAPQAFASNLVDLLVPKGSFRNALARFVLRYLRQLTRFDMVVDVYVTGAQRQAQHLVTETMMTIELPGALIRLGDDLKEAFPPDLQHIANPDLLALLEQIDPTPDSTRDSGTHYWGDLPDRLHFIADMFRCYQNSEELFFPPFTPEQTALLKSGRLPSGRL